MNDMGRYIRKADGWIFCFQGIAEKVIDKETLKRLKNIKTDRIEVYDLWKK